MPTTSHKITIAKTKHGAAIIPKMKNLHPPLSPISIPYATAVKKIPIAVARCGRATVLLEYHQYP
jgi:hypothetical protein